MTYEDGAILKRLALAGRVLLVIATATPAIAQESQTHEFDIDEQELGEALTEFGIATGNQVLFNDADVRGKTANDLEGVYTSKEAIKALLENTGVAYRVDDNGTLLVGSEYVRGGSLGEGSTEVGSFRVAQLDQENDIREVERDRDVTNDETKIDVIVVTGTNIRGVENPTVPIIQLDEEYFDQSGYISTVDVFRDLPQNFAEISAATPGVTIPSSGASFNSQSSTNVDLRGLGPDSTLVLVNGRRLIPSGSNTAADISLVPLSAIDRIDVLTDGGSAIYGSDAVGGVVNFVLKDDYEGAETSVRYATPTREGGGQNFSATQSIGANWGSGNAFFVYEFSENQNLTADERDFSSADDTFVLPELYDLTVDSQEQKSLVQLNQRLADDVNMSAYGIYSLTKSVNRRGFNEEDGARTNSNENEQFTLAIELLYDHSEAVSVTLGSTYNLFDGVDDSEIPALNELRFFETRDEAYTFDARISGHIFQLPAGKVSYAIGGEYRNQESSFIGGGDATNTLDRIQERDVTSVFAELILPLVGNANQLPLLNDLQLSLATRYDDISDAGSRTTPKIGISWVPFEDLTLRSSFGESFKAPRFGQQTGQYTLLLLPSSDPLTTDGSNTPYLFVNGSPAPGDLEPETAETLTIGFDYSPSFLPGLSIHGSYFDINFEDRVGIPNVGSFFSVLERENQLAPGVVTRNPTGAELADLIQGASAVFNFSTFLGDPSVEPLDAEAIVDRSSRNIARQDVSGIDLRGRYDWDSNFGEFGLIFNVSYVFEYLQQDEPTVPAVDLVDTFRNPVDLRARSGLTWRRGDLSTSIFVDYVDSYEEPDNQTTVDAWTTADIRLAADLGGLFPESHIARGTDISVSIQNLFDTDPPFIASGNLAQPVGYDPINADPLGRVVALQLAKRW